eukprot:4777959-Prymnesium_polylepis.1
MAVSLCPHTDGTRTQRRAAWRSGRRYPKHTQLRTHTPDPCMTDPRAVLAPAWCPTSAWDPARVVRASRTRA